MNPKRNYDCLATLGKNAENPLWHWEIWSTIFPPLNELIERCQRGRVGIRCSQENLGKYRPGRLVWSAASHQRWTHGSPVTNKIYRNWDFISMETWLPGPTQCLSDGLPPDVFLSLNGGMGKQENYTFLLLAIAEDFEQRSDLAKARNFLKMASNALLSPCVARIRNRPWGMGDEDHYNECIQDYWSQINFKISFQLETEPKVTDFPWKWRAFKV